MANRPRSEAASRREAVLQLLGDHQWHSTVEIETAEIGGSQGTRRLRELRALGHTIDKRRKDSSTQWEYRLVDAAQEPQAARTQSATPKADDWATDPRNANKQPVRPPVPPPEDEPCPKCGEGVIVHTLTFDGFTNVECLGCGARACWPPEGGYKPKQHQGEAGHWMTRNSSGAIVTQTPPPEIIEDPEKPSPLTGKARR